MGSISRWTYRSWTYPWIHKEMDLVLQDMRPSELKFALVLSLWHPWSHLPGNGGSDQRLHRENCRQANTTAVPVPFISPNISYFMNPVLQISCSYESCFNTSIFPFPPKRTMFFCCFTVPNYPTLRGKSSESSIGSRWFFFKSPWWKIWTSKIA